MDEVLICAAKRIKENGLHRGSYAVDVNGENTNNWDDPQAVSWCMEGAVMLCAKIEYGSTTYRKAWWHEDKIKEELEDRFPDIQHDMELNEDYSRLVPYFNDKVCEGADEAVEILEAAARR